METNVGNIISNHEKQLINYLTNQISDTLHETRMIEKSLDILTEGDDAFAQAVDDIIQMKIKDMSVLKFRLGWLESQLKTIKSLNQ